MKTSTKPDYTLYLDETGDHTISSSEDIGKRYLGIAAPFLREADIISIECSLTELKLNHLPCHAGMPILHRKEIMQCRGPFACLGIADKRVLFDNELLRILAESPYELLAVVIDKAQHGRKTYRRLQHPYHYCLHALLERYCGYLNRMGAIGHVIAESRGREEDFLLRESYRHIYTAGTAYLSPATTRKVLFANEVEIRKKKDNVGGLQLADMLAHPATRDVLRAYKRIDALGSVFTQRVVTGITRRYHRKWDGRINGYGRILLA